MANLVPSSDGPFARGTVQFLLCVSLQTLSATLLNCAVSLAKLIRWRPLRAEGPWFTAFGKNASEGTTQVEDTHCISKATARFKSTTRYIGSRFTLARSFTLSPSDHRTKLWWTPATAAPLSTGPCSISRMAATTPMISCRHRAAITLKVCCSKR